MARVSYQAMLGATDGPVPGRFAHLGEDAIATRRKDARAELTVRVSRDQLRWLREAESLSGKGVDADAVVRALLDLGRELDLDWSLLSRRDDLRSAVRDTVLVRRPPGRV
jgi:hypothetical protein